MIDTSPTMYHREERSNFGFEIAIRRIYPLWEITENSVRTTIDENRTSSPFYGRKEEVFTPYFSSVAYFVRPATLPRVTFGWRESR